MEKINRWMAKHQTAARILSATLWAMIGVCWIQLGVPLWLSMLLVAVEVYIFSVYISAADFRLQKKPLDILKSQCDPYPLLEESNVQREYPGNGPQKQMRDINYAVALRNAGEYELAHGILSMTNIDKYPGMLPPWKIIYYGNLMDLCALMGRYQEAVIWYDKLLTIFHDMKPGRQKERYHKIVEDNQALYHFCRQEYPQTLETLGRKNPENLSERVEDAMLYARTYLAMGERERALKPLRFVAENGNKLFFATEAKTLLETINVEETI